jgi:hypothetical protein
MVTHFASRHGRRLRAACLLAAGSLLGGLAAAPPAFAAASQPAHAAQAASASAGAASSTLQAEQKAVAQAQDTGEPVPVAALTTPTSTTTADPGGTLTVTESAVPVRTWAGGAWRDLDATLVRNADGTWSPAQSSYPLALSGGGTSPLATMTYGGYSLSLTAPMTLPAPVISGATATYPAILPGVDLIVTAKPSGGYSEDLRVNNQAAAASTALASLAFTTAAKGLTVATASNGGISARNAGGQVIFAAPPPRMWDSTVSPQLQQATAGTGAGDAVGLPANSTVTTPAFGALSAGVGVSATGSRLTLVPDHGLLTRPDAKFPEYIDPSWDSAGDSGAHWAYITSAFPTTANFDGTDDGSNYLQVGEEPTVSGNGDTGYKSYAFYQLPVPSQIEGAHIYTATAYFPEVWADSCSPSPVDLYLTNKAISSSTTWNNPPGWGAKLGSDNTAYGWSSSGLGGSSSCATTADQVHYNILSTISADTGKTGALPSLNLGLQAESAGVDGWKKFASPDTTVTGNASLTIQYAFTPTKPTLRTSATGTSCDGTKNAGDGNVTLQATTTDKDGTTGNGNTIIPSIQYTAYAGTSSSNTFASNLPALAATAGANGTYSGTAQLHEADLKTALTKYGNSTTQSVKITWTATAQVTLTDPSTQPPTQTTLSSPAASCTFTFTTAQPGIPNLYDDSNGAPSATSCGDSNYTIGQPATFWATADPSVTPVPDSYIYQLNGGNPVTVAATASSPYSGKISVTPTRTTNILTVTAVTLGINNGQPATCVIDGITPPAAADQDLTGDGVPDLLTPGGGTTGIGAGLWLAPGQGSGGQFDGTVAATATDLAPYGPQAISGAGTTANPASWNGLKVLTGQFAGPGFNYVEAYTPGSPGTYIIPTEGDGSAVTYTDTSQDTGASGLVIQPYTATNSDGSSPNTNGDTATDYPEQLANVYQVSGGHGNVCGYPDQVGIYTDSSVTGSASAPSFLTYLESAPSTDDFDADPDKNVGRIPYILANQPPDKSDWAGWTLTSSAGPSNSADTTTCDVDIPTPAHHPQDGANLFLMNPAKTALYLWQLPGQSTTTTGGTTTTKSALGGTAKGDDGSDDPFYAMNPTATLAGEPTTPLTLPPTWPTSSLATLQATTIGTSPGLVTVTASGQVQTWTISGTTVTAVNNGASQKLSTSDHSYPFTDGTGTTVTDYNGTATGDSQDNLAFAGTSGSACWTTGGMFSPDVTLNENPAPSPCTATSGGYLTTSAYAFKPNSASGFTISAWVNPSALGSTVFSQNGASYSTIKVGTTTSGQWTVSMSSSSSASTYTTVNSGTARVGMWTQLTLTYDGYSSGSTSHDGILRLYANGSQVADFPNTSPPTATGAFLIGASQTNGAIGSYLSGEVADVQVWDSLAIPVQNPGPASAFVPMTPVRIMDTRSGSGHIGAVTGPVAAGATITVPITGANGIPATGVTAVAVAATVGSQTGSGYLTLFPDGESKPYTSTLNFDATDTLANNAIVPVGPDGKIAIYNYGASDQILIDVDGYFTSNTTTGSAYHPLTAPTRMFATGNNTGSNFYIGATSGQVAAGGTLTVTIATNNTNGLSIPSTVTAVALNVGAIAPAGDDGYLTAYPYSTGSHPAVSQLQFHGGETYQDTIIIPVSNGKIQFYNGSAQPIQIVGDLSGYFASGSGGQYYYSLDTTRILDTRQTSSIPASGTLTVPVPAGISNVLNPTLILNVTALNEAASGYLKANPNGQSGNGSGILDFTTNQEMASLAITATANSPDSLIISNVSTGKTDVIIDNNGYFA